MRICLLVAGWILMGLPVFAQQKKQAVKKKPARTVTHHTSSVRKEQPPAPPKPQQRDITPMIDVQDLHTKGDPTAQAGENVIYTTAPQMPEFPGGQPALMRYLSTNVRYPEAAKDEVIQGKVVLKFVVDKTGSVGHIEIVRDIGGGCGKEAVRVVQAMPKWNPGMKDGVPVNVYYVLPFSFVLSDPEPVKRER